MKYLYTEMTHTFPLTHLDELQASIPISAIPANVFISMLQCFYINITIIFYITTSIIVIFICGVITQNKSCQQFLSFMCFMKMTT